MRTPLGNVVCAPAQVARAHVLRPLSAPSRPSCAGATLERRFKYDRSSSQRFTPNGGAGGSEVLLVGGLAQFANSKRQSARHDAVLIDQRIVDPLDGLARRGAVLVAFPP